ncbi:MAG: (d)CMP kinase [Bauldia sp.]|nr:(d)CMP kinase [Bauldia sp.]
MIIAIDGPAASGKGTLGRRLAEHYGYHHLDTGLLYRAVAAALLEAGDPLDDEAVAVGMTSRIPLDGLDAPALSTHAIGEAASRVAVMPGLRAALVDRQRAFAAREPGAVLDGRDVGTVICPDAAAKIFLVASPEARARRRAAQLGLHSQEGYRKVLEDILRRDERDTNRAVAPLRPAADAHLLDTTDLDIEAAFRAALSIVERAGERS